MCVKMFGVPRRMHLLEENTILSLLLMITLGENGCTPCHKRVKSEVFLWSGRGEWSYRHAERSKYSGPIMEESAGMIHFCSCVMMKASSDTSQ